jgi:hypothetical protein
MLRQRVLRGILLLSTVSVPAVTRAAELGRVPGLQAGAAGESIGLSDIEASDIEVDFSSAQSTGVSKFGTNTLDGSGSINVLKFSGVNLIGKEVRFFSYANSSLASYEQTSGASSSTSSKLASRHSKMEFGGGPAIRTTDYILGAHVAIIAVGAREQTLETNAGIRKLETDGGTLPIITGYAGKRLGNVEVVLSYQTFNSVPSKGVAVDEAGQSSHFETNVKIPSEVRLDSKFSPQDGLVLAASVKMVATGQASGNTDDLAFDSTGATTHLDQENHLELDFGGLLRPQPWIGFVGGAHWRQQSFRADKDASIELDNLGSTAIDIGAIVRSDVGQYFFNLGYQLPTRFEYETAEVGGTETAASQAVDLQTYGWDIKLGLSVFL